MKITIPDCKLPSWNAFYGGMHWVQRRQLADLIHWQVRAAVNGNVEPFTQPVDITVTAYSSRPVDADNVTSKLIVDGLCLAGVLVDDSPQWVRSVTTRSEKGQIRVEVEIVESSGDLPVMN